MIRLTAFFRSNKDEWQVLWIREESMNSSNITSYIKRLNSLIVKDYSASDKYARPIL